MMKYIENLLQGTKVEWKPLGEVAEIKRGKALSKADKDLGNVPLILYGELYTTYGNYIDSIASHTSFTIAQNATIANMNDLLLPMSSTTKEAKIGKASVLKVNYPVYIGGDTLILSHSQNSGYLMYLINGQWFEKLKMQCVTGTTIMHLSPKGLAKIKIPIPPIEIQKEIVSILDKFTELETELETELNFRKKQYDYYRNKLLNFNDLANGGGRD